ncbi:hypothetical protein BDZ45DRAFT_681668 [Acephala macrosclerotiorum]|nr:hypothetical protein BDZ45DRAFT_681668 [Acephala macrosclerotiorum]
MDEPQPQNTDASMVDTRPESAESAISPFQAQRASTIAESEEEDSRTAVAGRKRGFQEAAHQEDSVEINMSDEDEPSRKRVKENEPSSFVRAEDTLVTNITSVSPVPARAEEEADVSLLPSAHSSPDPEPARVADAHAQSAPDAASVPNTWNAGVQGGLRTSFGKNTSISSATQPFKRLSKTQERLLSKEDLEAYKNDLAVHLHEKREEKIHSRKPREEASRKALLAHTADLATGGNDAEERTLQATDSVNGQPMNDVNMANSMAQSLRLPTSNFKTLSSDEIGRLSTIDRIRYWDAHFDYQKAHGDPPPAEVQSFSTGEPVASGPKRVQPAKATFAPDVELHDASDGDTSDADDSDKSTPRDGQDDSDSQDEDEDEDYSPHSTNQLNIQQTQPSLDSTSQPSNLSTLPVEPQFQKLTKGQRRLLSQPEQKKYEREVQAFNVAWIQYQLAKREYDAELGVNTPPTQFMFLDKKAKNKLSQKERDTYDLLFEEHSRKERERKLTKTEDKATAAFRWWEKAAPDKKLPLSRKYIIALSEKDRECYLSAVLHGRRPPIEKATQEAATVLDQVRQWPLPPQYMHIYNSIVDGRTFYPTKFRDSNDAWNYTIEKCTFRQPEIFDNRGLPLVIQELSFDLYAPAWVVENKDKWHQLTRRRLRNGFKKYVVDAYPHVIDFIPTLASSCDGKGAMSINEAKRRAELLLKGQPLIPQPPIQQVNDEKMVNGESDLDIDMTAAVSSLQAAVNTPPTPTFATVEDPDLRKTLVFLQQKYYPSSSSTIRCLSCAKIGHMSDIRPALNCMACGIHGKHSTLMCPRDMPCGKCRGHGHTRQQCPEKLFLPTSEMSCDLCGSHNHLETECHNIWRSFDPSPNEVIVVSGIPVYCYTCGNSGHYGPDCGLFQGQRILSGGYTFSEPNLLKYSDPMSRVRAISAGVDYTIPPRPSNKNNYSIKGKGRANDPITFDESEEDEPFLRPSVMSGNVPRGPIRFGNGQPPQAPIRSGPRGQGDFAMTLRGPQGGGGGGGKSTSGGNKQGERPKRARGAPGRRPKTRAAAASSGKQPAHC